MCILVILRNRVKGWPLVVGANRDEFRDRPWAPPARDGDLLTPRDLRAGGTWIALHDAGLLVAVTNRPDPPPDPTRPSRGLLALELARTGDPGAARRLLGTELGRTPRNAFQVLLATAEEARVAVHPGARGGPFDEVEIPDGIHTLTHLRGLDELEDRGALRPLREAAEGDLRDVIEAMRRVLGTHAPAGPAGPDEICKHGTDRGTLSSSILALPAPSPGTRSALWLFAPGPPCTTPYRPVEGARGAGGDDPPR